MSRQVLFLIGPTGSGKTELSICLAKRLGCEIISADSMLVYKGMDIGTAKPSLSERRKIPHHLIDLASPRSNFSAYQYRRMVLDTIEKVLGHNRIPLIVGGSGLYIEATWKGLSGPLEEMGVSSQGFRDSLRAKGTASLYARLQKIDHDRSRQIHPHDRRRIVRALEIARLSGKVPSEWYRQRESLEDLGYSVYVFGIRRERVDLYERINHRVEGMFRDGFIAEVKRFKKIGFSKTAKQALGYREILEFLKSGSTNRDPSHLIRLIQKKTRNFAKRQLTWLRKEKRIRWIDWERGESVHSVCDKIVMEFYDQRESRFSSC